MKASALTTVLNPTYIKGGKDGGRLECEIFPLSSHGNLGPGPRRAIIIIHYSQVCFVLHTPLIGYNGPLKVYVLIKLYC